MIPTLQLPRWRWLFAAALGSFLAAGCGRVAIEAPAAPLAAANQEGEEAEAPTPVTKTDDKSPWPMYGGTIHRNMVNLIDKNVPESWSVEEGARKNIKWTAELGSQGYGGPVVAGGKIFVSTNNGKPRDPKIDGDKGVVMCFRESDGKFLWQAVHDKLDNNDNDFPDVGIASTPAIDGNCVYYVSNRAELVCADVEGDPKTGQAKFNWKLDMIKELKVYPFMLASSSPAVVGDLVFVVTGNGIEGKKHVVENPEAPSFLAVDKKTGKVAWSSNLPGKNIMEGQWGNPAAGEVKGVMQVVFPGGDGWLYGFEAKTGKLLWKFDCNPKKAVYKPGGRGERGYPVATPVIVGNLLYIALGANPEDGPGVGHLWCIDIAKEPKNKDLSPVNDNFDPKAEVNKDSGLVWHFGGHLVPKPARGRDIVFGRSLSTVCVHEGLVYAAEFDGYLHCLDAKTGEKFWSHDMKDGTWSSPYYVDGRVFIGTEGGDVLVFEPGKAKKLLKKIEMGKNVQLPVVVANGVLYINVGTQLYAIAAEKK